MKKIILLTFCCTALLTACEREVPVVDASRFTRTNADTFNITDGIMHTGVVIDTVWAGERHLNF